MKKWIAVFGGLLTAQLVLAVAVNLAGETYSAFEPTESLIAANTEAINNLKIEDDKQQLVLSKRDGEWVLPGSGDFPADQSSVQRLLERLADMKKGWPVATTAGAAKRFKVASDVFERKLTLLEDEKAVATLYLGTSPGFRKVHVRPEGDDEVYAVAFNTWELNTSADDWIDQDFVKIQDDDIEQIELHDLVLKRDGDQFHLADLGDGEETKQDAVQSLVDRLTGMQVQSVLGAEELPEFRQEEPELEIRLLQKDGAPLTYRFSKPKDSNYFVLKRSDLEYYFKVAEFAVSPIKDTVREKLVQLETDSEKDASVNGDSLVEASQAISEQNE